MGRHLRQGRRPLLAAHGFADRTGLLSHTALATTIILGSLILVSPASAGDITGGAGTDGPGETSTAFPPELIEVDGAGSTVSRATDPATGDNGGAGDPGTGTAAVNLDESSNGTGGAGGLGGDGTSGAIGALDIILNEDISNALSVTLTTGAATGGNGGAGGAGTGGTGGAGSSGGAGLGGGAAVGQGGSGSAGGDATSGDATVTVTPGGDISVAGVNALAIAATTGAATGGNGGAGGAGKGGTGGTGGAGGSGGGGGSAAGQGDSGGTGGDATVGDVNVTVTPSGDITVTGGNAFSIAATTGAATGGNGGAGGAGAGGTGGTGAIGGAGGGGGSAAGQGGSGNTGGDATGGDANVTVTSSGDITVTGGNAISISATTGAATGGNGGAGGAGTGGTGGTGGLGGSAGGGGSVAGQGGAGSTGGDATGGNANVTVIRDGDITVSGGNAISISATTGAATGGNGGAGGAGTGGTGGTGGAGGAGGGGGSANGQGGSGDTGGAATSGDAIVSLSNGGNVIVTGGNAISITAEAGAATGGNGGAGGAGTGGAAGPGGIGASTGPAGSADGQGSSGVTGGAATGGDAIVTLSNGGDLTVTGGNAITIIAEAGNATGGNGGAGGDGTGGTALDGGGGDGGGAQGGSAEVKVTNDSMIRATGNGIDVTATAGAGTGGTGGTGATTGLNGAGTNGSSSIKVDNSAVVDVDGIGVRATAKGDNGTIAINNTGGTITGGLGGVVVQTDLAFVGNGDIDIVNSGVITADNLQAINAKGASTEILNSGTVLGRIDLTAQDDSFDNQAGGIFAARGTSTFGAGADIYNNLAGSILDAADAPGTPEDVQLNGLEQFRNNALITLVDGTADDRLTLSADAGDVAYSSSGGRLQVDAVLGSKSDFLTINGDVVASLEGPTTPTRVAVNAVGVSGASDIGVIEVTGTANAGDFVLEGGPLNVGFFTWDMRLDEAGHIYELFASGIGTGSYEFAAGITATQDIWYQTTGTLLQRQADLRPLLTGTQVTPVADYSEPVAPTPAGQVGPGFWLKGVGAWLERDQGDDLSTTDRKQSIYGGLAGFDFAVDGTGDAWLFGLYGGYLGSKLKFNETDTEWTYDGPTVGAYATYLNDALYVDMVVKADFLNITIDPDAPGVDDEDTDAVNLGGLIDAGYKFGSGEGVFVEPQAALAVLHTEIDDVDIFGGTVNFEDETSVRGRLGLRLGYDHTAANAVVYSSDVTASVWQEFNGGDNDVTIATADFPAFGVSDAPDETVGDISLGFSVAAPEGWSGFARGSYQFADGYDAYSGNLGLRYSW